MDQQQTSDANVINIEALMQEIRQQILDRKDLVRPEGNSPIPLHGERLSPEFYEHLYQAGLVYDQIGVKLQVTKSSFPLIGPLLDRARLLLHELVLFYVNKLAAEQMHFNTHILHAVSLLAQELEAEGRDL